MTLLAIISMLTIDTSLGIIQAISDNLEHIVSGINCWSLPSRA